MWKNLAFFLPIVKRKQSRLFVSVTRLKLFYLFYYVSDSRKTIVFYWEMLLFKWIQAFACRRCTVCFSFYFSYGNCNIDLHGNVHVASLIISNNIIADICKLLCEILLSNVLNFKLNTYYLFIVPEYLANLNLTRNE